MKSGVLVFALTLFSSGSANALCNSCGTNSKVKLMGAFRPPSSPRADLLGEAQNWPALEKLIKPFSGRDTSLPVSDEESEKYMKDVCRKLSGNTGKWGWTLLHTLVDTRGGDNKELIEELLALGMEPDIPATACKARPSHLAGINGRPLSAQSLMLVRPDLKAKRDIYKASTLTQTSTFGYPDDTPERVANRAKVAEVWKKAERDGFPRLAALAADQQWFAVKNLCRRRVIGQDEAYEKYKGRNAVEWAEFHGREDLVDELVYLLGYPRTEREFKRIERACAAAQKEKLVSSQVSINRMLSDAGTQWIQEVGRMCNATSHHDPGKLAESNEAATAKILSEASTRWIRDVDRVCSAAVRQQEENARSSRGRDQDQQLRILITDSTSQCARDVQRACTAAVTQADSKLQDSRTRSIAQEMVTEASGQWIKNVDSRVKTTEAALTELSKSFEDRHKSLAAKIDKIGESAASGATGENVKQSTSSLAGKIKESSEHVLKTLEQNQLKNLEERIVRRIKDDRKAFEDEVRRSLDNLSKLVHNACTGGPDPV